ncbi:hypothetical protein PIB30_016315 [Stylosanthes scabra]|uniref:Retrotransposon gag domain-containing protein n=1 Tax=Stylosanthes scabra TaxID=79078 RepID=A0ABU6R7L1_9FABA|nr:hypothetical protein [Stylosanthes scabra]
MVDAQLNNEGADESISQFTPEKGIIPPNQNIQQMETALRELLERQTREAEIATEAMKRAEAMAAKQQALLEEAEKRDQELRQKLQNKLSYIDESEGLELPKKFKYPTDMEPYDGSSDPKHHLDAFDNRMMLLNASDATKCKAFSVTLKKDALTWFNSLAPESIKSFSDLSGGLREDTPFLKSLTKRQPKTMEEIQERSHEYLQQEEGQTAVKTDRDKKETNRKDPP